jgi:hypothetical protein
VGFVFADLLHDAEVIDGCEEAAPRIVCDWFFGEFRGGEAELVDLRGLRRGGERNLFGFGLSGFVAADADERRCGVVRVGIYFILWLRKLLFDAEAGVSAAEEEETYKVSSFTYITS